jgi:glycine oxidase
MPSPSSRLRADVVVIGGGVAGCSAAWFLALEGLDVLLVERDAVAAHASGAAAGMLAPVAEAEPASPLLRSGLAALAQLRDPLCAELQARTGIDPEFEPSGVLRIALSDDEERALSARAAALRQSGIAVEWLDARAAAVLQPGLAPELRGASWSPDEAHVRSPLLTRAYAAAAQSLGARVVAGTAVTSLVLEGDRVVGVRVSGALQGAISAGCVVVCAGSWSGVLETWLDACLTPAVLPPVEPIRGQILSLREPAAGLRTIVWGAGTYLVPKRDGSIVVGATEERAGFDASVTTRGMAELTSAAPRLLPALADAAFEHGWAGLRPSSPDGLPSIGRIDGVRGLIVAYGHYRNGVLLSPISGQLVRDLVLGKHPGGDAAAFDPARFARREVAWPS